MATRTGNNFRKANEAGKEVWYWEDEAGSQCGRKRKWKYEVQRGDSVREAGDCPQGYKYFEFEITGTPTRI